MDDDDIRHLFDYQVEVEKLEYRLGVVTKLVDKLQAQVKSEGIDIDDMNKVMSKYTETDPNKTSLKGGHDSCGCND